MVSLGVRSSPPRRLVDPATLIVFDLLYEAGESLLHLPYRERRARLEALELRGPCWHSSERFEDGEALYATVCERDMEGIVAKPSASAYRPGYRGWLKIKNPSYWRREQELYLTGSSNSSRWR